MNGLDPAASALIAKLAGMLGSDHEGERATAAALATRHLQAAGVTWAAVIEAGLAHLACSEPAKIPSHVVTARWALSCRDLLSWKEIRFIEDISRRRRITEKQGEWLERIVTELREGVKA
ncbi:hypothetical protein RQ832_04075 [Roseomonas sp. DSM 102946]|nr:hypothetical protein [Roseomonas sp. DSM 102946]